MTETKTCSAYRNGQPYCAPECKERAGVWPATREFFLADERKKDGLQSQCRACQAAYLLTPKSKARLRAWRQAPKGKAHYAACQAADRAEVLALYGNACQHCGETRLEILQLHHAVGRKRDGYPNYPLELRITGDSLVRAILAYVDQWDELPSDIELLCWECHQKADKVLEKRGPDMSALLIRRTHLIRPGSAAAYCGRRSRRRVKPQTVTCQRCLRLYRKATSSPAIGEQ